MTRIDRYLYAPMQNSAAADGNGILVPVQGYTSSQMVEIIKTGTGTCTVTIEGTNDQSTFYAVGYARVDGQATVTRAASGISIGAGTVTGQYQVFDPYQYIRARISATAGTVSITVRLYAEPD